MPVQFLTPDQRRNYGRYIGEPSPSELAQFFYLDDADRTVISDKRGSHNRLGFALQLTTARFLGAFLKDPTEAPKAVVKELARQLGIEKLEGLVEYGEGEQRWSHAAEIKERYGFRSWNEPFTGFRLSRWLYSLCWTGTEQPGVLFDRATTWMLAHKVILPGATSLERFIARLRTRVEQRLWKLLTEEVTEEQRDRLEDLLKLSPEGRTSWLDKLRTGPVRVSGRSLVKTIRRLQTVRELEISLPQAHIPPNRLAKLARFAGTAKVTAISRLPRERRLATLVAFIHCLEATAHDDVVEVLDMLLHDFFTNAAKADKKARLREIKDLDNSASLLASALRVVLDLKVDDGSLRRKIFSKASHSVLTEAVAKVEALVRPPDDVYYSELSARYRAVRAFLPTLLKHIRFGGNPAGRAVVAGFEWLRQQEEQKKSERGSSPPLDIVTKPWERYVLHDDGTVEPKAYTFCVLDGLRKALKRRDVFVSPSWRYRDPRVGLLTGAEWEATRPIICRSLGLSSNPKEALTALSEELSQTYRSVSKRLPENSAIRFEAEGDKKKLVLSPLDKLEESESLVALRDAVFKRLPEVDLPEILLEISARTGFTESFTHLTEQTARAHDLATSLCAVLLAEACNTGLEPLIRRDVESLKRERLAWVDQNYIREDTIAKANAALVAAQNEVDFARVLGGGEVASADGMRFVVPVRTVHAGPNPKYFGFGRGVTWYNLMSDQCSGLNGITVPGTLRDSLVLLAVVLEQQTELQPTKIMTDTGAYSDVVFGLFRLLGYRFSPRLADIGGTRFWRLQSSEDYGELNEIAKHRLSLTKIEKNWDDLLRLAGSLKLGRVPATGIMRTLQVGDRPTRLAQAVAELGRIEKTLHTLNYIDDEARRRATVLQLNRTEARHGLARDVFHGKRGELRQRYREGQEDQLGALGLVVNMIVLWNTIYIDAALEQLREEGFEILEEDVARLSPFVHKHINMLGRYSFAVPDEVSRGELRPLRDPDESS